MKNQKGLRLLYSSLNMRKHLNKLLSGGNLTQGEYLVLRNIWMSGRDFSRDGRQGLIKAAELSDMLELSRPSITRILNDLEKRGLIIRNINKNDRRSVNIELTEQGREALEKANGKILRIAGKLVESLGDADTEKLIGLIDKLTEIYKEIDANGGIADEKYDE